MPRWIAPDTNRSRSKGTSAILKYQYSVDDGWSCVEVDNGNVREAVCLADRVILFSRNPGRIREQFDIPLPRPRDINSIALAEHAGEITRALKGHSAGEVSAE